MLTMQAFGLASFWTLEHSRLPLAEVPADPEVTRQQQNACAHRHSSGTTKKPGTQEGAARSDSVTPRAPVTLCLAALSRALAPPPVRVHRITARATGTAAASACACLAANFSSLRARVVGPTGALLLRFALSNFVNAPSPTQPVSQLWGALCAGAASATRARGQEARRALVGTRAYHDLYAHAAWGS